jgi:chemotaxis protein MotB
MAFMVMLLTFAEYDMPAYQEAAAAIEGQISGRDVISPIEMMKQDIQDVVYEQQADQAVEIEADDKGIVIELASSAFYKPGSADFRDEALPVLLSMVQLLDAPRFKAYIIEVEGHTDDDPIRTVRYPSNWELSAGRAIGVVRYFIEQGMFPKRLKAVGFADSRPKVPNRKKDGTPIPANQAENRRVIIRVYPMSLEERATLMPGMGVDDLGFDSPGQTKQEEGQPGQPLEGTSIPPK